MATLKQLASQYNYFTAQDIPNKYSNESLEERLKLRAKKVPEFLKTLKGYECDCFFKCTHDTDIKGNPTTYYVDYSVVLLKKEDSSALLILYTNREKNSFFPLYETEGSFDSIHYEARQRAIKHIAEPNQIGVFTEKKVAAWVKYCEDCIKAKTELLSQYNDENEKLLQSIEDFINSLPKDKIEVVRHKDRVYITTPLFRVDFTHYKDQKYLQKKIEFRGDLSDVSNILQLIK